MRDKSTGFGEMLHLLFQVELCHLSVGSLAVHNNLDVA